MTFLRAVDPAEYANELSREDLGWIVAGVPDSFRPVHRVRFHPTDGPIFLAGESVFEVNPETDEVYATDEDAMDAYYADKERHGSR